MNGICFGFVTLFSLKLRTTARESYFGCPSYAVDYKSIQRLISSFGDSLETTGAASI